MVPIKTDECDKQTVDDSKLKELEKKINYNDLTSSLAERDRIISNLKNISGELIAEKDSENRSLEGKLSQLQKKDRYILELEKRLQAQNETLKDQERQIQKYRETFGDDSEADCLPFSKED